MDDPTAVAGSVAHTRQDGAPSLADVSQAWLTGCHAISRTLAGTVQARVDHAWSIWASMGRVRSVRDAVDLQAAIARRLCEQAVADAGALGSASAMLVAQGMAPMRACMALAATRPGTPARTETR